MFLLLVKIIRIVIDTRVCIQKIMLSEFFIGVIIVPAQYRYIIGD